MTPSSLGLAKTALLMDNDYMRRTFSLAVILAALALVLTSQFALADDGIMLFWEGSDHPAVSSGHNPVVTVWKNGPSVQKLSLCIKGQACAPAHGIGNGYWQAKVKGYAKPGRTYYWEARYRYQGKKYVDWSETVAGRKRPKPCQTCG
jgi:hypothetical protein